MRHLRLTVVAAALALTLGAAARADFSDGEAAFAVQDYAAAAAAFRPLAEAGDARAQIRLGTMHRLGLLGAVDFEQARRWLEAAASQGDAAAHHQLAAMYLSGEIRPRDRRPATAAAEHLRIAAESGLAAAQAALAGLFADGRGVDLDRVEAYRWYQLAAWQREPGAADALARLSRRMSARELARAKALAKSSTPAEAKEHDARPR